MYFRMVLLWRWEHLMAEDICASACFHVGVIILQALCLFKFADTHIV